MMALSWPYDTMGLHCSIIQFHFTTMICTECLQHLGVWSHICFKRIHIYCSQCMTDYMSQSKSMSQCESFIPFCFLKGSLPSSFPWILCDHFHSWNDFFTYCANLLDMTMIADGPSSMLYVTLLKPINQYYSEVFQQLYQIDNLYLTDYYRYIVRW